MAKPIINNYDDLMLEKQRLKSNLRTSKRRINASFNALKDEVNPFSKIKQTAQTALRGDVASPIVQFGIKRATDLVFGKILLRRSGWLTRLLVPIAVRQVTKMLVGNKADKKIAKTLHTAADKVRDADLPELGEEKR